MTGNQRILDYGYEQTASKVKLSFFHMVYGWMAVGLALTAAVSYLCQMYAIYPSRNMAVVSLLGLFGLAWLTETAAMKLSVAAGTALYLLYAAVMGYLISFIWVVYPSHTLMAGFAITGGMFLVTSAIGFITKADLSKVGFIFGMAAMGLFAASIVNIFLANDALSWVITYGVVLIFTVLIVVKTKALNDFAELAGHNPDLAPRVAILGTLTLYIAFINIFLSILRILGSRK